MIKPEFAVTADGRQLDSRTVTDSYIKAVNINRSIIVNAQAAQMSLYEVCKGLKEMRDNKLYKELGYQNFEEYAENEVGMTKRNANRYVAIAEMYEGSGTPVSQNIGVTKLALLASLSEDERSEVIQNTDLEAVSKRELEMKISEIRSLKARLEDTGNALRATANEKKELEKELDSLSRQRDELSRQLKELEERPIDVAVSDNSHEVENLKKAMDTIDKRWAEKYSELEENTIKQKRELHEEYGEKIEKLTAEYEKKLSEIPQTETVSEAVPDMRETFKAYYSMAFSAFDALAKFVKRQSGEDKTFCTEKADRLIQILKESVKEN